MSQTPETRNQLAQRLLNLEFSISPITAEMDKLKDRLRAKFNVAVAEIEYQDLWQRAVVAAVTVSADRVFAEKVLQSVEEEAAALLGDRNLKRQRCGRGDRHFELGGDLTLDDRG